MKPDFSQTLPKQFQPPGLYIVATPVGNLQDITLRALDILKSANLIVCEDTRVTAKLLSAYGIKAKTLSYNDHNAPQRRPQILQALREGGHVVLISDAGTPLVSDPGYKLVRAVIKENIYVTALPGASSILAALCLCGLPSDRFFFAGFLPAKKEAQKKELKELSAIPSSLIFFESAKRLSVTLENMHDILGNRDASVLRELTKLHEEAKRGSLAKLCAYYSEHGEPKGEIVIAVSPPLEKKLADDEIKQQLRLLLKTHSVKEAASIMAEQTEKPRKELYSLALELMKNDKSS